MDKRYLAHGKRVDNGEWITGNALCEGGDRYIKTPSVCIKSSRDEKITRDFVGVYAHRIDPATLGQCTGLLAAKSYRGEGEDARLIFEGDVLTCKCYPFQDEGRRNYDAVVYWFEEDAGHGIEMRCVNPDKRGISNGMCEGFNERDVEWEIIGTIHDKPSESAEPHTGNDHC